MAFSTPVILDSNMGTWNAYNNLYWPAEYMIDMAGYIVHTNIGEGSYGETEAEIQTLLRATGDSIGNPYIYRGNRNGEYRSGQFERDR